MALPFTVSQCFFLNKNLSLTSVVSEDRARLSCFNWRKNNVSLEKKQELPPNKRWICSSDARALRQNAIPNYLS